MYHLEQKTLNFPPAVDSWEDLTKISDSPPNYMKKKRNVFLRLQRGTIRIKTILISFHRSPGFEKYHGATIFHLVVFLDHLKIINIMNTFWFKKKRRGQKTSKLGCFWKRLTFYFNNCDSLSHCVNSGHGSELGSTISPSLYLQTHRLSRGRWALIMETPWYVSGCRHMDHGRTAAWENCCRSSLKYRFDKMRIPYSAEINV